MVHLGTHWGKNTMNCNISWDNLAFLNTLPHITQKIFFNNHRLRKIYINGMFVFQNTLSLITFLIITGCGLVGCNAAKKVLQHKYKKRYINKLACQQWDLMINTELFSIVARRVTQCLLKNQYIDTSVQKSGIPQVPWCHEHTGVITQMTWEAHEGRGDLAYFGLIWAIHMAPYPTNWWTLPSFAITSQRRLRTSFLTSTMTSDWEWPQGQLHWSGTDWRRQYWLDNYQFSEPFCPGQICWSGM